MELVCLHHSVLARVWLTHLDPTSAATALIHAAGAGDFTFVAPDCLERDVLQTLTLDLALGTPPMVRTIAEFLIIDVKSMLLQMHTFGT